MMNLSRPMRELRRSTAGTALIEAAVILPLVVIIMGGIFDFGHAYATLSAAQKSLRGAVRYLSLLPSGSVCSAWALTSARNLARFGNTAGTGTVLITGWENGDITRVAPTACSSSTPVGIIKLSATVPYDSFMWEIVGLPETITMNVEHEERWIGQ